MGLGLGSGCGDGGGSGWGVGRRAESSSAGPELGGAWLGRWGEQGMPKIQSSRHGVTGSAKDKRTHPDVDADKAEDRRTDRRPRPEARAASFLPSPYSED